MAFGLKSIPVVNAATSIVSNPKSILKYTLPGQFLANNKAPALNLPETSVYQTSPYESILSQRALSQGPTQAAQYQMDELNRTGMNQIGQMGAQTQSAAAQGLSNLAMRGGAQSGARERLQSQAAKATGLGQQGIYGNMLAERSNILSQDEQNKQGLLSMLSQQANDRYTAQMQADAARQGIEAQYNIANRPGLNNLFGLGNVINKGSNKIFG